MGNPHEACLNYFEEESFKWHCNLMLFKCVSMFKEQHYLVSLYLREI